MRSWAAISVTLFAVGNVWGCSAKLGAHLTGGRKTDERSKTKGAEETTKKNEKKTPEVFLGELRIKGVPKDYTNKPTLDVAVNAEGLAAYHYAIRQNAADCTEVNYKRRNGAKEQLEMTLSQDGTYTLCVKGEDKSGKVHDQTKSFSWTLDTTPPQAAADATSFAVDGSSPGRAIAQWEKSASDAISGVTKQQIHLFGNDTKCSGTPDQVLDVGTGASRFSWKRFAAGVKGFVRFFIRATDRVGLQSDSTCSEPVKLRNGLLTFPGSADGARLGKNIKIADVTGDGIKDLISRNQTFDNNRGYVAVLPGGSKLWKSQLRLYKGDREGMQLGSGLFVSDMNKDGVKDLLVTTSETSSASLHVIPGSNDLPDSAKISEVGTRYSTSLDYLGLTKLVDVTGDDEKDLVLVNSQTAYHGAPNEGSVWLLPASNDLPESQQLSSAARRYDGERSGDYLGMTNARFEDLTGDGVPEMIFRHDTASPPSCTDCGSIYVIPGGSKLPPSGQISAVGKRYDGASDNAGVGYDLEIRDFNKDGFRDIISWWESSFQNGSASGAVFIIPGGNSLPTSGTIASEAHRYAGDSANDRLGRSPRFVDVTGDGHEDFVSVSSLAEPGGLSMAGSIFVIPGGPGLPSSGTISTVGYRYDGDAANEFVGSATVLRDVTNDGTAEILAGVSTDDPGGTTDAGSIYVIEGGSLPGSGTLASQADRQYDGSSAGDQLSVHGAFDLTGDSINDIIGGSPTADPGGKADAGSIVIIPGAETLPGNGEAATIGHRYDGDAAGDKLGQTIKGVYLNGDDTLDLVAASPDADPGGNTDAGSFFVVPGGSLPADGAISTAGYRYDGETASDKVGRGPYKIFRALPFRVHDVTGDGISDLISVHESATPGGLTDAGSVYVIPGGSSLPASGPISTSGYRYDGEQAGDLLGDGLTFLDLTGDGTDEIVSVAPAAAPGGKTDAGSVYVMKGGELAASGAISQTGVRLNGTASGAELGTSLRAQDVNGDGFTDLTPTSLAEEAPARVLFGNPSFSKIQTATQASPSWGDGQYLGSAVRWADLTGDGNPDWISPGIEGVTAAADSHDLTDNGALYVIPNGFLLP